MDYELNRINLESKNKFNKRNKILLALLIVVLLFSFNKYFLSNHNLNLNPAGKNSLDNFKTKQGSMPDFSYNKKPSVQTAQQEATEELSSENSENTPTSSEPLSEKLEEFIFGGEKKNSEATGYNLSLQNNTPENLILIVIDAGGSSYVSPEVTPNLLAISRHGFFTKEMKVKIPSTTESHTIILTGIYNESYDWTTYPQIFNRNTSLLDSARNSGHNVFAIMGKGDSPQLLNKTDAALHDSDNNYRNLNSDLKLTSAISADMADSFSSANNLSAYTNNSATPYISYNNWIKDSAKNIIRTLARSNQKFILVINFPGLDEGGHENFDAYYLQTFHEIDSNIKEIFDTLVETNLLNKTAFAITADHGMEKTRFGRGAHADRYNDLTLKIPFLLISPSIKPHYSEELYYNDDITPTLHKLLNLQQDYISTGAVMEEIFSSENFIDVGILNLSYNSSLLTTVVKNYANLTVEDELCTNVSAVAEYAFACTNITLSPFEKQAVLSNFPFSQGGFYKIVSYLGRADSNPRNDNFETKTKVGQIHDLGIGKISIELDDANPQKIKIKIRVLNYGDYPESSLEISIVAGNIARNYGPYSSDEIKVSKTVTSTWTLNQTGEIQVTAKITNYTNFATDAEQENNIKSTSIHIG